MPLAETFLSISRYPDLIGQYNEIYRQHTALRDELLDLTAQSGQVRETSYEDVTTFYFSSLRAGVKIAYETLDPPIIRTADPIAIEVDIRASTKGEKTSPGYLEQGGHFTPDFPLFIGHMSVTFADLVKLSSDPEDRMGTRNIGHPFVGFGMRPLHCVELDLPPYDQLIQNATEQAAENNLNQATEQLEPEITAAIERGKVEYQDFMARVDRQGTMRIDPDQDAARALYDLERDPHLYQNFVRAVLKAGLRTSNSTKSVLQLFQNYVRTEENPLEVFIIDTSRDLVLHALSKGHYAHWLTQEASRIDKKLRSALSPDASDVENAVKTYLTDYSAKLAHTSTELDQTKATLGPTRPV